MLREYQEGCFIIIPVFFETLGNYNQVITHAKYNISKGHPHTIEIGETQSIKSQKSFTRNFFQQYPYIIQQIGIENTKTQLEGYLDPTPNSCN